MNNVFDKVTDVKKKRAEVERLEKELNEEIFNLFINVPFKTEMLEVNYNHSFFSEKDKRINQINLYFPVLEVPEGYEKTGEEVYREMANCIAGKYQLVNSSTDDKITVKFKAVIKTNKELLNMTNVFVHLNNGEIVTSVNYDIIINDVKYGQYSRSYTLEELIPDFLKEEMTLEDEECKPGYETNKMEKQYQKQLEDFGATFVIPLANQKEGEYHNIGGTRFWTRVASIRQITKPKYLFYKGENVAARLVSKYVRNSITVEILSVSNPEEYKSGNKIAELQFTYEEPLKEVKEKVTYDDVLVFEKQNTEEIQS